MRVFGGGFYLGPSGKYPSLKVCDEIDAKTLILMNQNGENKKIRWTQIHDTHN